MALYSIDPEQGFVARGQIDHSDLVQEPVIDDEAGDDDDHYYDDYYWNDYVAAPMLRRSLKIGGTLYTISEAGLKVSSFESPEAPLASQSFPEGVGLPIMGGYGCYDFQMAL